MNNEQPLPPQQTENTSTPPPVLPPTPGPVVAPSPSPHKSKLEKVLLVLLLVVITLGGVIAWLLVSNKNNSSSTTTKTSSSTRSDAAAAFKTTTLTYGGTTVSVRHPASWSVVDTTTTTQRGSSSSDVLTLPGVDIKSDKGHYLHLFAVEGIGGTCVPNNDSYTLTERLLTATDNVYFVQYTTTIKTYPVKYLSVQTGSTSAAVPAKGYTGTDTCTNLPAYSMVHAVGDKNGIYVTLSDSPEQSLASTLLYSDISSDLDFIAMLQSLTLK